MLRLACCQVIGQGLQVIAHINVDIII
jgi:hypothetical protein